VSVIGGQNFEDSVDIVVETESERAGSEILGITRLNALRGWFLRSSSDLYRPFFVLRPQRDNLIRWGMRAPRQERLKR